jgi:serine/threonine protein kinase
MLSGELPWSHHEAFRAGKEPLLLYIGTHPGEHPEIPKHASAEAQDLLRVLFRADPKARGTAAVALLHPFFAMEAPATPLSQAASMSASVSGPGDTVPLPFHQHHHHHTRGGSVSLSRQASGHTFGPPCSMEVTSNAADTPPPLAGVSGIVGCSTLHTEAGVSF